ncbi:MAG: hypothetical protein ACRD1B_02840, partial [Thermoanaerobaculia bacterium]
MTSSDTRRFALFGVGLEITTGCRELWSAVKARLPPLEPGFRGRAADRRYTLEPGAGPDSPLALRRGSRKPVRVPDADRAADLLVDDLERFVAHRAPGLVF